MKVAGRVGRNLWMFPNRLRQSIKINPTFKYITAVINFHVKIVFKNIFLYTYILQNPYTYYVRTFSRFFDPPLNFELHC